MRPPHECLRCFSPLHTWEEEIHQYTASQQETEGTAASFHQQFASRAAHPGDFSYRGRRGFLCYLCYEGLGHPEPVVDAGGEEVSPPERR